MPHAIIPAVDTARKFVGIIAEERQSSSLSEDSCGNSVERRTGEVRA
jgi:hypothetical protein